MRFAAKHSQVIGTVAGIVVGVACTIATDGAGAILCGGLAGLVTGLTTGLLDCAGGDDHCVRDVAEDAAIGTASGLIGGGLSEGVGTALEESSVKAGLRSVAKGYRGTTQVARKLNADNLGRIYAGSKEAFAEGFHSMGVLRTMTEFGGVLAKSGFTKRGATSGLINYALPQSRDSFPLSVGHDSNSAANILGGMLGEAAAL